MNIRPFEIGLIGFFGIVAVAGLLFLANFQTGSNPEDSPYGESVTIWGTFDQGIIDTIINDIATRDKAFEVVEYKRIDPRAYESELLNAIAEGRSPDLVILPHTLLVTYRTKLQAISSETIDSQTFRDTYIDGAEIFLLNDGLYGVPFAADPLVMYWNRDIFSASGLAAVPKTWEALVAQTTPAITKSETDFTITQSAVALGEFENIVNAKEILSMLFIQAGTNIVEEREHAYTVTLGQKGTNSLSPGEAAVSFYTQFVVPGKNLYSWNRSKPNDRSEFLGGTLALYFGKGSERKALERENANLNFDIAMVPQGEGAIRRNYADFYAFAIPRASDNIRGAYAAATFLASPAQAVLLAEKLDFAPVARALYDGSVGDPQKQVIYQSALIARGWLDPSPKETKGIFQAMVEEYTSGGERIQIVLTDAVKKLEALFR